ANVRPYYALGADESAAFSSSGLQVVRWPGGAVVDRYNVSANRIYNDDATSYFPPTNVSEFAQWCRSVSCRAMVGLPAEINDPATAAYYVAYIEKTVGFVPDSWEIGNEPTVWTHFGWSWSSWTTAQNQNATPSTYAQMLHRYIAAIRAVDPAARIVGLGGLGTGAWGETSWISAAVRANGANLSGVSIHVYPAGGSTPSVATPQQFFGTLTSPSALAVRVPADRAAIAAACRTCHIDLIASELGSGTDGGPYDAYMAAFPVVPYLAAEFVQALSLNLSQVDLFALEGTYDGSILNDSGVASSVATLYHTFLLPLRSNIVATNLTSLSRGFYVLATQAPIGGASAILVANTNLSAAMTFQLQIPGVTSGTGSFTTWTANGPAPIRASFAGAPPASFKVGPESVGLIVLNGGIVWDRPTPSPPTGSFGLGLALALPAPTVQGILSLAAPTSLTFPCWAVAAARRRREFD
ncbi:MAG: hypothetical protein L3J73_03950, partial [Thermoplasmata archaeon]|nr:hypothetical protein [Thermoplasmata archaeon]